ncbi:MAG TPA: glycosyltransferase family 4 protein [Gemmataceae bacterium]|nr:glycosyltransferase family 4 protein [Gemmataceae bacterium]
MHVAQFVHRYPPALGGAEAWTARLSKSLVEAGHHVTVWTTTAIDLSALTRRGREETLAGISNESGVMVRRYQPSYRWAGRRPLLKAASLVPNRSWQSLTVPWGPISRGMWRDAGRDTEPVDVVHAVAFPYAAIIRSGLRLAWRLEVPFVITPFLHLGDPDDPVDRVRRAYTAPHLRWLLRHADRVLVQTPTEGEAVRGMGIPKSRIVHQGLGVDPDECTGGNRVAARAGWGIAPNELVIGHLANQSAEKGTIDLLRAAGELRSRGQVLRVVLAGPAMPSFTTFWERFGSAPWVKQLGPLTDWQKRDFFAGIDVFALPSRSDSFGLVFLEAWANCLPVIGYRAGGVADVIRHQRDGLLVRCGDLTGLQEAISQMMHPDRRRIWGTAGRERLGQQFRWDDKLRTARAALTQWC